MQPGLGMPDVSGGWTVTKHSAKRCRMHVPGCKVGPVGKNEFVEVFTVRQVTAKIALDACAMVRRFGIFK